MFNTCFVNCIRIIRAFLKSMSFKLFPTGSIPYDDIECQHSKGILIPPILHQGQFLVSKIDKSGRSLNFLWQVFSKTHRGPACLPSPHALIFKHMGFSRSVIGHIAVNAMNCYRITCRYRDLSFPICPARLTNNALTESQRLCPCETTSFIDPSTPFRI